MFSFVVFDSPARVKDLAERAFLIGPDDVPIGGAVYAQGNALICEKTTHEASGLTTLFDVGECGVCSLQTCLLPEREAPYLLSLELARHRIMLFLNKLEEWVNGDIPADEPAFAMFEKARSAFTRALSASRGADGAYTKEQDELAREALCQGICASERLALLVADVMLRIRLDAAHGSGSSAASYGVGAVIRRDQSGAALQRVVRDTFDFVCMPMRWTALEPEEGEYSFTKTDKWVEWAVRDAKLPVHAGPLIDFRAGRTPEWLHIWENDYDTLREVCFEHLKRVVTRYRKAVSRWVVCSGLHLNDSFPLTLEQLMDLTRLCVLVVKKLQPSSEVVVEIDQPFGEHYATNDRSAPPLLYAEMAHQQGVDIDAFGLRIQMGDGGAGRSVRDMMRLSAMLDTYAMFDRPLAVTALGAPSGSSTGCERAGAWRKAWSGDAQAEWIAEALTICLSKPFVRSVCWQELYDPPGATTSLEQPLGGLIGTDGKPKPGLARIARMRQMMRERRTPLGLGGSLPEPAGSA
ncbi:MAG: endo-1,4-beta-xylanase [Phycisphaerales bacterium]